MCGCYIAKFIIANFYKIYGVNTDESAVCRLLTPIMFFYQIQQFGITGLFCVL